MLLTVSCETENSSGDKEGTEINEGAAFDLRLNLLN